MRNSKVLPDQVYSGILDILHNDMLYHNSFVGTEYCRLTEEGQQEVIKWINMLAPHMLAQENKELDERAKRLVVQELKK